MSKKFDEHILYKGPSMNPTLKSMDKLKVVPYNGKRIKTGDVIVFIPHDGHEKVTHRVVDINVTSNKIRTKGDNNNTIDPWILAPHHVLGKVVCAARSKGEIRIHNGTGGKIYALGVKIMRNVKTSLLLLLHPAYRWFSRKMTFMRVRIKQKIRILSFNRPSGMEYQALMDNRIIARRLPQMREWQIMRPFRLFVEDSFLSEKAGCNKIGEK